MDYSKIFINKDERIVLNVPYLEVYIPQSYFAKTSKLAEDNGDTIRTMGCRPIGLYENGKFKEYKTLKISEMVDFYVYDSDVVNLKLPGMDKAEPVRVLKYFEGNEIMNDYIIQNSSNCASFMEMLLKGGIPSTVAYDDVITLWNLNLQTNHTSIGIPGVNRELIVSVQYRDKDQPTRTFGARVNADPNTTMYDYSNVNMRQICQYTSTFTAITFEDIDSMITSSLKRTKDGAPEPESPLEQIIKM